MTEADARVLEYGSTIVLAAGGHVTPLAQDTLRARRVTVVADVAGCGPRRAGAGGVDPDRRDRRRSHVAGAEGRARAAPARPRPRGARPRHRDHATRWTIPTPRRPRPLQVARGEADAGDRHRRRRPRVVHRRQQGGRRARGDVHRPRRWRATRGSTTAPTCSRSASTLLSAAEALAIVDVFIDTPMREARYIRRLAKIRALETRAAHVMAAPDLERLIRIIVEEVAAAAGHGGAGPLRLPRGAVRVLSRSAARRDRGRRVAPRPARRGRRRRRRGGDDRPHAAQARRHAGRDRGAVPRGGRVPRSPACA